MDPLRRLPTETQPNDVFYSVLFYGPILAWIAVIWWELA